MRTNSQAPSSGAPDQALYERLRKEIGLNRNFKGPGEAALLALVHTWQRFEHVGREFFAPFGITDAQFNVLMILWDYRKIPLRQHELADLLLVNRASVGSILARMEQAKLVSRTVDAGDTRARIVELTKAGSAKLEEVRRPYYHLLGRLFRDDDGRALDGFVQYLDQVRSRMPAAPTRVDGSEGSD